MTPLIALLACCAPLCAGAPQDPPPERPPQRQGLVRPQPIAGLAGFECSSRVRYASAPEREHSLRTVYLFPDRARWDLALVGGAVEAHSSSFRSGERLFEAPRGGGASRELEGAERADLLRRIELRRALMLWPDGFAWNGAGRERSVELAGGLGSLRARVGADGALATLTSLDARGRELEQYAVLAWREAGARRWPAELAFSFAGEPVWREALGEVTTQVSYLESHFLPVDRRGTDAEPALPFGRLQHVDLPGMAVLRVELPEGLPWSEAFAAAAAGLREREGTLRARGLALEPRVHVELDDAGRARAYVLRLADPPAPLPEGWKTAPERPALTVLLPAAPENPRSLLEALLGALPEGAEHDAPYLAAPLRAGLEGPLQVVVPLRPRAPRVPGH